GPGRHAGAVRGGGARTAADGRDRIAAGGATATRRGGVGGEGGAVRTVDRRGLAAGLKPGFCPGSRASEPPTGREARLPGQKPGFESFQVLRQERERALAVDHVPAGEELDLRAVADFQPVRVE